MRERKPVTETMNAAQARNQFGQVLDKVHRKNTRVLIEKGGVPVAAIVSAEDLEYMCRVEAQREERFKALDSTREAFEAVPPEELEIEVAKAIAEVRAENRMMRPQNQ